MNTPLPAHYLQLRSLVREDATLELSLRESAMPVPADDEVLLRVEASPINPSDIGNVFGPADFGSLQAGGDAARPVLTARIPPALMGAVAARVGKPQPAGNEGAGTVVAAGASAGAQALLGRLVAAIPGGMYAQYRVVKAADCLPLPAGATAADGASCFVNPLTALGMVETMRMEGHKALVHTAAASNLGQMLVKICAADGVPLVNVVRKPEQAALLRGIGAVHVVDTSAASFAADLAAACEATGATLAFDAVGGGPLAGQILHAMETALLRAASEYNRYGSPVHKQVYQYGMLDTRPTEIRRSFGMAWGVGGWLLWPFLGKAGPAVAARLRARVAAELKTTFASHYSGEIGLAEMLRPDVVARYAARATGDKLLVNPQR